MLLCDAADDAGGKLYVLGGGWTDLYTPGAPSSMALAILLQIPWDQANERFTIKACLVTDDGEPVVMGDQQVEAIGQVEVGRPAGLKKGSTLNAPLAMRFMGIVLEKGGYVWELHAEDTIKARAPFRVVDPPGQGG